MEAKQRKCRNKQCQNILPEGDSGKYCEVCRARKKNVGQTILDLMMAPGIIAMSIATKGNRHYRQEKDSE